MNKRAAGTLLYTGHRVITHRKGKKFTFPFATFGAAYIIYIIQSSLISRVLTNHYGHDYRLPKGIFVLPGGYRSFLDKTHKPSV